jgi:beta-lactamase regulating signal transducer with metallopeptidase domain
MDPLLHAILLLSKPAAGALLSAIWEGAVLAACVALSLRLLPGLSAAARSLVWANVFLLLLLLHILPSLGLQRLSGSAFQASPFHLDPLWSVVIAGVWMILSLWRGAQLIASAIHLRQLAARATCVQPDAAIQALLKGGRRGRGAQLCTSAEVERPSVFGFFHPRILLPLALFKQLTAPELEQIVLHEMEHLRRADDWTNLAQKACLVLFPLNPVLLWVERRLSAERELACDDRVLRSTGARKAYAICLTRLAEHSMLRRSVSLALGAWERRPELARRVHRILRWPYASMSAKQTVFLTGSLILGVMAGSILLARSPQVVSFTPRAFSAAQARSLPALNPREMNAQEPGASPMLVKAVMPRRSLQTPRIASHQRAAAQKRGARRLLTPGQPAWILLTEWDDAGTPPRLVIAVAQDRRSSYAAVAIADGWLIVRI